MVDVANPQYVTAVKKPANRNVIASTGNPTEICGFFVSVDFMVVKLKQKTIKDLKKIMAKNYKVSMSDNQINDLGVCLLRLSRLALVGLARAEEMKKTKIQ